MGTLSERMKRVTTHDLTKEMYYEEDVKEFIKKLKEAFCDSKLCLHNWQTVLDCKNSNCSCRIIDELAGDKLTKEQEQEKE